MATTLKEREVVIVGGGLSAGLLARRLVPLGRDVLVLERGAQRSASESQLPSQRDDLRWSIYRGMTQRETSRLLRVIALIPGCATSSTCGGTNPCPSLVCGFSGS